MKDLLCDIDSIENYDALRKSSFALPQPKLNKSKSRYGNSIFCVINMVI